MRKEAISIIMKIKYILLFFVVVTACQKQETKNPFIVQVDDKRIELILEDNADYLVYDMPTKAEFVWTNIEKNSWIVTGRGIRLVEFKKDRAVMEINYPSEKSTSDTLEIQLKFKGLKDPEFSNGIIKVPVKRLNK